MNRKGGALFIASLSFFAVAIYAYLYESRSTGFLPVITYPLRTCAVPLALSGLFLLLLALIVRKFPRAVDKTSTSRIRPWTFTLTFLFAGFMMKILGEVVHELLGHGSFVLLFGGRVTDFHISLLWPYELSRVEWSMSGATLDQVIWITGGGILVSAILSFLVQVLLFWKRIRWQFSVPLFWFSFWCYIGATGYLIVGGFLPFGDVEELIRLRALTSFSALMIGGVLFIAGFFILSEILRRMLETFLNEKTRWGVVAFWFVIPALVTLTMAGRGIFHFLLVSFSFITIVLSYLLEFQIRS